MLEGTITLNVRGQDRDRKDLVRIGVYNDGTGNQDFGNYVYAVSLPAESYPAGLPTAKQMLLDETIPTMARGRITDHDRQSGATLLWAHVLLDAVGEDL